MTRFARAKGSKASNERAPNEATPWHLMKQQLVENLSKHEESSEKLSAKQLLQDNNITTNENDNDWAEFNETSNRKGNTEAKETKKKKKKSVSKSIENNSESVDKVEGSSKDEKHTNNNATEKKLPLKRHIEDTDDHRTEVKVKKKKQKEQDKKYEEQSTTNTNISEVEDNKTDVSATKQQEGILSKRQKRNMRKRNKHFNENEVNTSENYRNDSYRNESYRNTTFENRVVNKKNNHLSKPKIRDNKEHKRRKDFDTGFKEIILNGVRVQIAKFDGFPVTKEDADRLCDLKQKMIMKGIPKKDIDVAMKLERRRAERTLARMRKSVCFHCRKGGHNLSDCPELSSQQAATGICFKCGSTEHTHFECKVSRPTEFRYATCFICREQGHIAKQCPDNPKGVYPQGGCCKICGDVTHLKKDCPDLIKEKEETAVTVNTITNDNVESLEEIKKAACEKDDKKSKKVVKF